MTKVTLEWNSKDSEYFTVFVNGKSYDGGMQFDSVLESFLIAMREQREEEKN